MCIVESRHDSFVKYSVMLIVQTACLGHFNDIFQYCSFSRALFTFIYNTYHNKDRIVHKLTGMIYSVGKLLL